MRKKKIILPQLNNCEGDLSQRWFVYYSVHNPKTDNLKRFKVYKGFDKLKTSDGRYSHAEKMMTDLRKKLQIGWSPFIKEDVIVYMDEIMLGFIWHTEDSSPENIAQLTPALIVFVSRVIYY